MKCSVGSNGTHTAQTTQICFFFLLLDQYTNHSCPRTTTLTPTIRRARAERARKGTSNKRQHASPASSSSGGGNAKTASVPSSRAPSSSRQKPKSEDVDSEELSDDHPGDSVAQKDARKLRRCVLSLPGEMGCTVTLNNQLCSEDCGKYVLQDVCSLKVSQLHIA